MVRPSRLILLPLNDRPAGAAAAIGMGRPISLAWSLSLHVAAVSLLLSGSTVELSRRNTWDLFENTGIRLTAEQKSRVIWYAVRNAELPAIRPNKAHSLEAPKIHSLSHQRITAEGRIAADQLVQTPAPEAKTPVKVESPNMVAIAAPRTPPKIFSPPAAEQPRPAPRETMTVPAPELSAAARLEANRALALVNQRAGPAPRKFAAPPQRAPEVTKAPELLAGPETDISSAIRVQQASVLRTIANPKLTAGPAPRAFAAPPARRAGVERGPEMAGGRAPDIGSSESVNLAAAAGEVVPGMGTSNLTGPRKAFSPPAGRARAGVGAGTVADAPPEIEIGGGTGAEVNAVVINLRGSTGRVQPPDSSQMASLSAGRTQGSGTGLPGSSGTLRAPGLSVDGPQSVKGTVVGNSMPPGAAASNSGAAARPRPQVDVVTVSTPLWPGSRSLKPFIEGRFGARVVYVSVAVPPAGGGPDWVLWFGEQTVTAAGAPPLMRPPVLVSAPSVATLPRSPSASRIYFAGIITRDGAFQSVVPLSGESPFNGAWVEALETMRFAPARRNGAIVPVEAVIEIPLSTTFRVERKP